MKETTPSAMPPCFDSILLLSSLFLPLPLPLPLPLWCRRLYDVFTNLAQKKGFRHYIGALLGSSERKNLTQMSQNAVGVAYHSLHHFLTEAIGDAHKVNEPRLDVMQQCRQTQITRVFTLIIDDSGHRKSGNSTAEVGRQYIGEIGKTDNGVVLVTTHLYDVVKPLPLDVGLYQHASSLPEGKEDPDFIKKPDIALKLIDLCLKRGEKPGVVLSDAGYGNNSTFLKQLESRQLKYIAGVAKNRKVFCQSEPGQEKVEIRLDELAKRLKAEAFTAIRLELEVPKTVWAATVEIELSAFSGTRTISIGMNAPSLSKETEVDYLITNFAQSKASGSMDSKNLLSKELGGSILPVRRGMVGAKGISSAERWAEMPERRAKMPELVPATRSAYAHAFAHRARCQLLEQLYLIVFSVGCKRMGTYLLLTKPV